MNRYNKLVALQKRDPEFYKNKYGDSPPQKPSAYSKPDLPETAEQSTLEETKANTGVNTLEEINNPEANIQDMSAGETAIVTGQITEIGTNELQGPGPGGGGGGLLGAATETKEAGPEDVSQAVTTEQKPTLEEQLMDPNQESVSNADTGGEVQKLQEDLAEGEGVESIGRTPGIINKAGSGTIEALSKVGKSWDEVQTKMGGFRDKWKEKVSDPFNKWKQDAGTALRGEVGPMGEPHAPEAPPPEAGGVDDIAQEVAQQKKEGMIAAGGKLGQRTNAAKGLSFGGDRMNQYRVGS
jgi:hypothetical protein